MAADALPVNAFRKRSKILHLNAVAKAPEYGFQIRKKP
jgi:hypothetical protein